MLKKIPEIQDGETFSNALLAMRFFIAEQLQEPNPLSFSDEKDIEFFDYYLSYLSQLRFDDISHWTPEQFDYYNKLGFPADYEKASRKSLFDQIKKLVTQCEILNEVLGKALRAEKQARKRFMHWFSVFMSRTNVFMFSDYEQCNHVRDEESVTSFNKYLNTEHMKRKSVAMIPLFDMINHRQPVQPDLSDLVSYRFQLLGVESEMNSEERRVGLVTMASYKKQQEFSYSYSLKIDVMQMLTTYGMAFENSPFAPLTINSANLFGDFKQ